MTRLSIIGDLIWHADQLQQAGAVILPKGGRRLLRQGRTEQRRCGMHCCRRLSQLRCSPPKTHA